MMAERLTDITTQLKTVRQLGSVVTAMRGIAAARAQQSRALLGGTEAYSQVIVQAIEQALSLLPSAAPLARGRVARGVILFCAEQGFAGAFSDRVFAAAAHDLEHAVLFLVGTHGAARAIERGLKLAWSAAMAAHVDGVPGLANRLAEAVYARIVAGAVTEIELIFSRLLPAGGVVIDRHSLFPVELGRFAAQIGLQPPLTTLPPAVLLEHLAEEYVYARLCQAAMHAFEAENGARMMAMAAAKTNIDGKLEELSRRERQLRQEEITAEVMELTAGTKAIKSSSSAQ
jgi:F-type H+-transporting ATPase subunit gamma